MPAQEQEPCLPEVPGISSSFDLGIMRREGGTLLHLFCSMLRSCLCACSK